MILARLLTRVLGVVNIAILARLLMPEDFGLIAAAWTVVMFLTLFAEFNFEAVLVQKTHISSEDYDTAFTLNLLIGLAVATSGIALAGPMAAFFSEPRLQAIIAVLSATSLFQGLQNSWVVEFRRNLTFSQEFLMDVAPGVSGLLVTVVAAIVLRSYWALAIGVIARSVVRLTITYLIHPSRPRISLRGARVFFNFSKWIFLNSSLHYFYTKFADVLIAKNLGAANLGVFRIGNQIASLATTELAMPINRVLFPGYSRVEGGSGDLKRAYLQSFALLAYFGLPAALGILAIAEPLVLVLLGAKWENAIPVIEIMALHGALYILSINDYAVYMAKGQPKTIFWLKLPYIGVLIALLVVLTSKYGIIGSAIAFVSTDLLLMPLFFLVRFRTLSMSLLEFMEVVWRPVLSCLIMLFVVRYFIGEAQTIFEENAIVLTLAAVLGGGTYVVTTFVFWSATRPRMSAEVRLFEIARKGLQRVRRARAVA